MRALALLAVVAFLAGCQPEIPEEPQPRFVTLPAGAVVDLILLDTIASGDREGRPVPLLVRKNLADAEGNVLIAAGTVAEGKIENSRAAGALSTLVNQPARLTIRLDELTAVDGQPIRLTIDEKGRADQPLELTREMTEKYSPKKVEEAVARKDTANVLRSLADQLESGGSVSINTPETRQMLESLAQYMDMPQTARVLKMDKVGEVQKLMDTVRQGGVVDAVTGGAPTVALEALFEIVNIAGDVQDRVRGMFRGRNIRAYAGTELTGVVLEPARVRIDPPQGPELDRTAVSRVQ